MDVPSSVGPYAILEPLGQGGMGVVYRARHGTSGQTVALKTVRVPHGILLTGIRREIHALARLRHPGIVRVLEEGVEQGLPWYAMEMLEGVTLQQFAARLFPGMPGPEAPVGPHWWTETPGVTPPPAVDGATLPGQARGLRAAEREPSAPLVDAATAVRTPALRGEAVTVARIPAPAAPAGRSLLQPPGPERGQAAGGRLGEVLTLLRRLCAPLAYLHGEGIVHRDLKPQNVLLRSTTGVGSRVSGVGEPREHTTQRRRDAGTQGQERWASDSGLLPTPDPRPPTPVIVDFGLVTQFSAEVSREALAMWSLPGGTAAYMAPEQARGELVDARADLYSLGCLLYKLVSGRPPFVGRTLDETLWLQLEAPPQRLSDRVEGVPEALDELGLQLLAKRPRDRLGHANDVAAALAALGAADGRAEDGVRPRPYLYRPGVAGRQAELERLARRLAQLAGAARPSGSPPAAAASGSDAAAAGGLVLVAGESGVGKTRLLLELVRLAEQRGLQVLMGECIPIGASSELRAASEGQQSPASLAARNSQLATPSAPLQPLRAPLQAVADRCLAGGWEATERLLGRRGRLLALYEPALGGLPGQDWHAAPAELPAEAARLRLLSYLAETFVALCGETPVLLVLDDLQWADELTLAFLDHLLRTGRIASSEPDARVWPSAVPLLVLGAYRSEDPGAHAGAPLRRLIDSPRVARVELSRLDEHAVAEMIGEMLAASAPPHFVRSIAAHSEGNPFFVAEFLRAALAEGLLDRDERGRWQLQGRDQGSGIPDSRSLIPDLLPLPRSVSELVERRLQGLPETALRLVEAASVVGREAELGVLFAMLEADDAALLEALDELLRRQVLEMSSPGQARFLHDKLREAAYGRIGAEQLAALHRAAAEALERHLAGVQGESLVLLGHHGHRAGEAGRARHCYLVAARAARDRHAHGEAERLYRLVLDLSGSASLERAEVRVELGRDVLALQGRLQEAADEQRLAVADARELGEPQLEGRALLALGSALWQLGRFGEARERVAQALGLFRDLAAAGDEAQALGHLATIEEIEGHLPEALALERQSLEILRSLGDRRAEMRTLDHLGIIRSIQGQMDESRALHEQALAIARETGDRVQQAACLVNLAIVLRRMGRLDEARPLYGEALPILEEIGHRRFQGMLRVNFGNLEADAGRPHEALDLYREALEIVDSIGDRRTQAHCRVFQAMLLRRAMGDLDAAEFLLDEAACLLEDSPALLPLVQSLCERGHVRLARGQDARRALDEARAVQAASGAGKGAQTEEYIARLSRAIEAAEAGAGLIHGERPEDLPEGLRRWLIATGRLGRTPDG